MTTARLEAPRQRPAPRRSGRSLTGYLLVPRPKDLVKAMVLPLGFAVGAVAEGGVTAAELGRAALVWFVLELLVYQARYQWNDVRGFAADQAHPDAAERGRLPGPLEKGRAHISASLAVLVLRLLLTAVVAVTVTSVAGVLLAMTIGVFGAAVVYERVRSAATGRSTEVPVPLRPALVALWVVVGAGYAVRGLTGLALSVDLTGRPGLVAVAAAAMWALGVVFVTCRWALEAMPLAQAHAGRLVWRLQPHQAREHTVGLVRWLPDRLPHETTTPSAWRPLREPTPLHAPWHLALVVALAAAAEAGRLLVGGAGGWRSAVTLAAGAAAAVLVAAAPRRRLLLVTAAAACMVGLQAALGADRPLAAAVPAVVVLVAYLCFTGQCAAEVGQPLRRLRRTAQR